MLNEQAELGDVRNTEDIFFRISCNSWYARKTMVYNTLLKACANSGEVHRATAWYRRMTSESIRVNHKTF